MCILTLTAPRGSSVSYFAFVCAWTHTAPLGSSVSHFDFICTWTLTGPPVLERPRILTLTAPLCLTGRLSWTPHDRARCQAEEWVIPAKSQVVHQRITRRMYFCSPQTVAAVAADTNRHLPHHIVIRVWEIHCGCHYFFSAENWFGNSAIERPSNTLCECDATFFWCKQNTVGNNVK